MVEENKEKDWKEEFEKCKNSPYYFATNYWIVNGKLFTTLLTEEEFNSWFKINESKVYSLLKQK